MIAFSWFGFNVYWYGIFYAIAFLFAYIFLLFIVRKAIFSRSLPSLHVFLVSHMDDIFLYAVLGVFLGGRLGHILIYDFHYYLTHPLEVLMIWRGGMSFIGGIIGVVLSLSLLVYKYSISLKDFFALGDVLFIPTSFGIMIGRIGNFLNQELYGIPVSSSFASNFPHISYWAAKFNIFYIYSSVDSILRVNTNFLASFFEGFLLFIFLFVVFFIMRKKEVWPSGRMVGMFFIWYSVVRFFLEYLRVDSQSEFIGLFTKSQWFFLLFSLLAVIFLIVRRYLVSKR